ncbi:MAG: bifunctional adenosylcobinamide kinase/adenosylcobinamide-phosphate guanylyltransferase [Cellvibrionales bacterium]|nr:bifunctional adenosylcobinamide kinase/adenosylcobinamide-phosphate guanylyltransferase [Cellvibrionales bacterium]
MIHLVLGGARSGKSHFAESLVAASLQVESPQNGCGSEREKPALYEKQALYIATAEAKDNEMSARIAKHQADRAVAAVRWQTVEETKHLACVLEQWSDPNRSILVDCLTLWVTNCLFTEPEDFWQKEKDALLRVLPKLQGNIILVANEVGLGVVPIGEVTRKFVDEAGWLNQAIAKLADNVTFVAAGCPLTVK